MSRFILLLACLAVVFWAAPIEASYVNAPVPSNAYITKGGLDWAWAYPLPAAEGIDLSYQSQFGWRLPTLAELADAPQALDFLVSGGNVPFNSFDPVSLAKFNVTNSAYLSAASAGAVAVPYFSNTYYHADWQDGLGQPLGPWAGMPGARSYAEQLVVRPTELSPVPEPTSIALFGIGGVALALAGLRRRR